MYITEFELESFCGGPPLRFLDLGNGLNVALAPSIVAARQLLHVIPGTLFGDTRFFSSPSIAVLAATRRTAVLVRTEDGAFRVERNWGIPDPPVVVTTGDGQFIDVHRWDAHRARVSAAEYADVFTFDVRRLRRLLQNPSRAIRALQSMARELDDAPATRSAQSIRMVRSQRSAPFNDVIAELSRLSGDLAECVRDERMSPAFQLDTADRQDRRDQIHRAELALRDTREQLAAVERECEKARAALLYLPIRDRLAALELEIAGLPNRMAASANGSDDEALKQLEERIALVDSEWKEVRAERAALARQRKEWERYQKADELAPQLEAVLWQEKALLREEDALRQLQARIDDLEEQVERDRREAQSRPKSYSSAAVVDANVLTRLDALADRLRDAERDRDVADQALAKAEAAAANDDSAEYSLAGSTAVAALQDAQDRVTRLRDELESRDDVRQLRTDREQLDRQVRQLYREQLVPLPTVLAFGIPFALGVAMIIHALMTRVGAVNWQQILWGFGIALVTSLIKILRDRERDRMLIGARSRLERIDEQLAEYDREQSDGDGDIAGRLQNAERELQSLADQRSESASRTAASNLRTLETARRRSSDATGRLRDLAQQWRTLMIDLNLSPSLTPAHAREALAERARRESETVVEESGEDVGAELRSLRTEWERRQHAFSHQLAQFRHFAKELGREVSNEASMGPLAEILHHAVRDAKDRKLQRDQVQRTDRRLRQREADIRKNKKRLVRQRQRMQEEAKHRQEQRLAQEKELAERREQLVAARDRLQREAETLLSQTSLNPDGPWCALSENELRVRAAAKNKELATLRERAIEQAEHVGRLRGQLQLQESADVSSSWTATMASIRPIVDELQSLQDRVKTLADQNSKTSRAFANEMIHESRFVHVAARHLARFSNGEFPAVALRGPDRQLVCRNQQGRWRRLNNLPVAQYANVYFALWLARLDQYAARGIRFPIILQDPLLVTPTPQKTVIARTLKQTAAKGHQMLLVTNLPRNASVLAELGVPIADVADRHMLNHWTTPQPVTPPSRSTTGPPNPRPGESATDTFLTVQ